MEGKRQNRIQEVSADEKGRQIPALAIYCVFHRQAAIPEKGTIRRIVEVLEETSLPTWTSCRARPRKESKIWPKGFGYVVLTEIYF